MEPVFATAMAGAASAHQAATASREDTSQQRAVRTRRTSADPRRAQQGATAAPAAAPAALDSLSRLQQLADASHRVAQLQRLQALANGRFAPVAQLAGGPEEEELVQGKFASAELPAQLQQAPRANNTGLPDQLKSGIESLSGMSMDHVRVHYNSSQPAQLNALAYAQGTDIHLAPGQERHLPHEAWHVVQQAQGRVRPTMQMKDGVQVNDDVGLEREADVMGSKALGGGQRVAEAHRSVSMPIETAQLIEGDATNSPDVNVANNNSAPLVNGPSLAQRGGNEVQRIADQRPEAALQRQVQAWGDGSERVGGKRQETTKGFAHKSSLPERTFEMPNRQQNAAQNNCANTIQLIGQGDVQNYLSSIAPASGPIRDYINTNARKNGGLCAGWVVLHRNNPDKLIELWRTVSDKIENDDDSDLGCKTDTAVEMYMRAQYHFAIDVDNKDDYVKPNKQALDAAGISNKLEDTSRKVAGKKGVSVKNGEIYNTALMLMNNYKGSKKHLFVEVYSSDHTAQMEFKSGHLQSVCESEIAGVVAITDTSKAEKMLSAAFFVKEDPEEVVDKDTTRNLNFDIHASS
jgi:hypothetical protein